MFNSALPYELAVLKKIAEPLLGVIGPEVEEYSEAKRLWKFLSYFLPLDTSDVDKRQEVAIFGEPMRLRAEVVKLNELSGHADQSELLAWMKPIAPKLRKVFLVHGEPRQSQALAQAIKSIYGIETLIPHRGESFQLD